jgi:hypothetical protein
MLGVKITALTELGKFAASEALTDFPYARHPNKIWSLKEPFRDRVKKHRKAVAMGTLAMPFAEISLLKQEPYTIIFTMKAIPFGLEFVTADVKFIANVKNVMASNGAEFEKDYVWEFYDGKQ